MIQRTRKAKHNRQTQSGPKQSTKISALRRRLKTVNDIDEVTLDAWQTVPCEKPQPEMRDRQ